MVHEKSDYPTLRAGVARLRRAAPAAAAVLALAVAFGVRYSGSARGPGERPGHRPGGRPGHRPGFGPGPGVSGRHRARNPDPWRRPLPDAERAPGQLHGHRRAHRHADGDIADHGRGGSVHDRRLRAGAGGARPRRDRRHGAPPARRAAARSAPRSPRWTSPPLPNPVASVDQLLSGSRAGRDLGTEFRDVRLRLADPPARQRERGDVEPARSSTWTGFASAATAWRSTTRWGSTSPSVPRTSWGP